MTSQLIVRNSALAQAAKRLLHAPWMSVPAGIVYTAAVSILGRAPCSVRFRDGLWEYKWKRGAMLLDSPTFFSNSERLMGGPELLDLFFWDYTPKTNDVVFDIGAGIGEEIFALRTTVGPDGEVFAFEAHPKAYARLRRVCALNKWANVEAVNAAVIDTTRRVNISDSDLQGNNVFEDGANEIAGIALDDFVDQRGITRIDYLKMNIEGAESLAIRGMQNVAGITNHMCISCHDFLGTEWGKTSEEVRAWLISRDFRVLERPQHQSPWGRFYLYAAK